MVQLDRKKHWENIYQTRQTKEVSWFQAKPETSLQFIESFNLPKSAKIIDIGGGDSLLVDNLIDLGFQNIDLLDPFGFMHPQYAVRYENDMPSPCLQTYWFFDTLACDDEGNLQCVAEFTLRDSGYADINIFEVDLITIDTQYQGRGLGPDIYAYIVNTLDILLQSSPYQSPGALSIWSRLRERKDVVVASSEEPDTRLWLYGTARGASPDTAGR